VLKAWELGNVALELPKVGSSKAIGIKKTAYGQES